VQRNKLKYNSYELTPVEDFTIFTGFSCLRPEAADRDLDDFIHEDAARHYADKIAITYALVSEIDPQSPIGFVTLQNDAILVPEGTSLPEVSAYKYHAFPAVKIGRLGIRIEMQNKRFGSLLLFMIKLLMTTGNRTGCRFITVDAWRDRKNKIDVRRFYSNNQFNILSLREKHQKQSLCILI